MIQLKQPLIQEKNKITILKSIPIDKSEELSPSIVRYTAKSKENLILTMHQRKVHLHLINM